MRIQDAAAERIAKSGPQVAERVTEMLAAKEIDRRVGVVDRALQAQDRLEGELRKLDRPDVKTYTAGPDGKQVAQEAMSAGRYESVNKAKEQLGRLTRALDAALAGGTAKEFEEPEKAIPQGGGAKQATTEA